MKGAVSDMVVVTSGEGIVVVVVVVA